MSNPEGFRDYLENALTEHRGKQKRQKKKAKDQKKKAKRREKEIIKQQNQAANQAVAELDSQFPIRGFIEELQAAVVPLESVRKYGPKDGKIAYAFPYRLGAGTWVRYGETVSGGPGGEVSQNIDKSFEIWRDVFGATLNHEGIIRIQTTSCSFFGPGMNPLNWDWDYLGNRTISRYGGVNIQSENGLSEFTQQLTIFYLEQKA